MTSNPASHERPCFCETCIGITLYDLLDERASLLYATIRDGMDREWLVRDIAEELIAGIPAPRRQAALEILVNDHLSPRVMNVDCLLDECDDRSYTAVAEMSRILLGAIAEQGNAPHALCAVIRARITKEAWLLEMDERIAASGS
jgi:hypothetical protein